MCGCHSADAGRPASSRVAGYQRPHPTASPDPSGLELQAAPTFASSGRGDTTAVETRAAVAVQSQEVPWFFAATRRPEGFGAHDDNTGDLGHVPPVGLHRNPSGLVMAPWLETHPTVIRTRLVGDDGLSGAAPAPAQQQESPCPQ